VIRLSTIPAHFSTAVFAACDVKFWHFAVATFLAQPKQIVFVYLGVLLVQHESDGSAESSLDMAIKMVAFGAMLLVTILLGIYIWRKMRVIRKVLLAEQDARRSANADLLHTPGIQMQQQQQQQQVYPLQLLGTSQSTTQTHHLPFFDQNPDSRFDCFHDEESAIGQAVTTHKDAYYAPGYTHLPITPTLTSSPSSSLLSSLIHGHRNPGEHDSWIEKRDGGDANTPASLHENLHAVY